MKYLQRVRQILKSPLNGKNNVQAINMPVIGYAAGQRRIETTDIKTRKLLTMHGGFHHKSVYVSVCIPFKLLSLQKHFLSLNFELHCLDYDYIELNSNWLELDYIIEVP